MEFRVLGSLEVLDADGHPLALGGRRARLLLALLLLHANEPVTVGRLVDGLWGEAAPPTARKVVQNLVSQLRHTLGDRLETHGQSYRLRVAPGELDLERFRRLVQDAAESRAADDNGRAVSHLAAALALWRGPALADIDWERRTAADLAWLEELRLAAVEDRVSAELELGVDGGLVGELEQLVAEQPLRERLRGQLMLALYRAGRQADALAAYRDARSTLVETLGIEPSDELQALERAILSHDRSLEPPVGAPSGEAGIGTAARRRARPRARAAAAAGILLAGAVAVLVVLLRRGDAPIAVAPNSVAVVDARSGRLLAGIRVGTRPVAIAVGSTAAWVANADDGTLSRIDTKTRKVTDTVGIRGPLADVAVAPRAVWAVTGSDGHLVQLDPRTDAVVATYDLSGHDPLLPSGAYSVAAAGGFVWVASDTAGGSLLRLLPPSVRPKVVLRRNFTPWAVVSSGGAVWATFPAGGTARVDPRSAAVTETLDSPSDSVSLALGGGSVWIGQLEGLVWQFDPATATVTRSIPVAGSPLGIAAGGGRLWVAGGDSGTLSEIDPDQGIVVRTLKLGGELLDVAYGDGLVWVTVAAGASSAP